MRTKNGKKMREAMALLPIPAGTNENCCCTIITCICCHFISYHVNPFAAALTSNTVEFVRTQLQYRYGVTVVGTANIIPLYYGKNSIISPNANISSLYYLLIQNDCVTFLSVRTR